MSKRHFTPMQLARYRQVQELMHDAAEDLGNLRRGDMSLALTLQLSSVLDLLDRAVEGLEQVLEMGT